MSSLVLRKRRVTRFRSTALVLPGPRKIGDDRIKAFKLSTDPQFVEKVRDIVGLYRAASLPQK